MLRPHKQGAAGRPRRRGRHFLASGDGTGSGAFTRMLMTARRLHAPGGCPWDHSQTIASLLPHLVEEAWEAYCEAKSRRRKAFQEELGDVLYTAVFLALLAEREGWFTLDGMLTKTTEKMIRRHPHVFGGKIAGSAGEAYVHWQEAKLKERKRPQKHASTTIRPLLVQHFEEMRKRVSGSPRRPSARSTRGSSRSRAQGSGSKSEGRG